MSRSLLSAATALAVLTPLTLLAISTPADALVRTLAPGDGGTGDHLGASVALDGDTLVAGAPGKDGAQGAVYVFTRTTGETWTQTAKLVASDPEGGDALGTSVAIEGDTIVAGAPGDDQDRGSVYVFSRTGPATRTQTDVLVGSDPAPNDALGTAVDLDGGVIVAGAPGDDVVPGRPANEDANHGSVYTFAATGVPGRAPTAKLTASDNVTVGWTFGGSALGSSVAIDGDTIVAGAPLDNYGAPSGTRRGSVYTFAATGAGLRQETAKLSVSGTAYGRLGVAVDVQGDLVVAGDDDGNSAYGTVYTFARTGAATRHETGLLRPANPVQNSGFAQSVSLSAGFVAVGAPSWGPAGGGYVFTRTGPAGRGESWSVAGATGTGAAYGASIATDDDRVVAGAPYVDASEPFVQDRGSVYSSTPDLYVSTTGAGSGTVTSSPAGIAACASSCSASFLLGDQVTLTATPGAGSHFAGWENYSGCAGAGTGPCTFTMTGQPQVVARFEPGASDTTPPALAIDAGPTDGSTVTSGSVSFAFSADETSTYQCAYDAAALTPCTSPGPGTYGSSSRTGLAEGSHTFRVRATDTAGNASVELTRTFTVDLPAPPPPPPADTTPPQTRVTQAPPRTVRSAKRRVAVRLSFASSEASSRFVCSLDGQPFRACSSPARFTLTRGKHTIRVAAVDRAGNRDRTPVRVVVKVVRRR